MFEKITSAVVEVVDHNDLLASWRQHGGPGTLVGRYIVRESLTKSQLAALPPDLRELIAA